MNQQAPSQASNSAGTGLASPPPSRHLIEQRIAEHISNRLSLPKEAVDLRRPFSEFGLTSVDALHLIRDLENWLGQPLSPILTWQFPTIEQLSAHLSDIAQIAPAAQPAESVAEASDSAIAIVGMGCRFPGAPSLEAYWALLDEGRDAVTEVPPDRWDARAWYDPDPSAPGKMVTRWGGFLDRLQEFDAAFFGISPREAVHLDPRQRVTLEAAWEALEDAGIPPDRLAGGDTGVFIATLKDEYGSLVFAAPERIEAYSGTGNADTVIANRISYVLDLHGPSLAVNTACSGSLVAIHLACESLQRGECGLALVGGVNVILTPDANLFFSKAGALSPDGRCRTFDARANGIVRSEGAGVVVLKPLAQALADGDRIYALVRGSAVNQDGRSNGIMAPNRDAQEAVLRAAYANAGISPGQVQYVEAHGTGTRLGDPIEVEALGSVLRSGLAPDRVCAIGSVKTNIGHTEAAAGMAGVIKVALALHRRVLPASLHFEQPNPLISFDTLPLRVQRQRGGWPYPHERLLAGVSGFGFGGTNAHVVLEEPPAPVAPDLPDPPPICLLPLSARSQAALTAQAAALARHLEQHPDLQLRDVAATIALRRGHLDWRLAVSASDRAHAIACLRAAAADQERPGLALGRLPARLRLELAFVFSGQGSHWVGMSQQLQVTYPVFRATLERCDQLLRPLTGWSLLEELARPAESSRLNQTSITQPAIFAIQVALADLWQSWGVRPSAVVGQSLGEVAAAHVAGALSLEDAIHVVYHRSRLMARVEGQGRTAVVALSRGDAQRWAETHGVAVAGSSSPATSILSGDPASVAAAVAALEQAGVYAQMLRGVDVALHSSQMDPLRDDLALALRGLRPQPAKVPLFSTVTAGLIDGQHLDAAYWARNLREPFLAADTFAQIIQGGVAAFLEVSPHPVLTRALNDCLAHAQASGHVVASLRRDQPEAETLQEQHGSLYTIGYPLDWQHLYGAGYHTVALPHYPWQRERYWFPDQHPVAPGEAQRLYGAAAAHPFVHGRIVSAAHPGEFTWELLLSVSSASFLGDHRVQGMVVLPGAAYAEMLLAAAAEIKPGLAAQIEALDFHQTLPLGDGRQQRIQIASQPEPPDALRFQIFSADAQASPPQRWTKHASGVVRFAASAGVAVSAETPDQMIAQATDQFDSATHYRQMHERGLQYGPRFQAITRIWRRPGVALAQLEVPEQIVHELDRYRIHPVILDACFQVASAASSGAAEDDLRNAVFLPVRVEQIALYTPVGARLWCRAQALEPRGAQARESELILLDAQGQPIGRIGCLRVERIDQRAPQRSPGNLLYQPSWVALPPLPRLAPAAQRQRMWVILGDRGGVGAALGAQIEALGDRCVLLPSADRARLRATLEAAQRSAHGIHGVIYLWGLDAPTELQTVEQLRALQPELVLPLVECVQTLLQQARLPQVWVVTRGAQPVGAAARLPGLAQAPLWGVGRAIYHMELVAMHGGLIDLDPAAPASEIDDALALIWEPHPDEDQLALRDGVTYGARLERAAPAPSDARLMLQPNASYLISGGLGDLGLLTAQWLVEQGARRLILLGRSGLPPRREWHRADPDSPAGRQIATVRALEAQGISVHVAAVDLADPAQLAGFLEQYRAEGWPPIRGVVHAAGVVRDQILAQLDQVSYEAVVAPKLYAAWNLHQQLGDQPLDFFVLFSSLASVLTSTGQASYAAGNAFLDALAYHRRALGLPGLSINWGPWASGMISQLNLVAFHTERGMSPLAPALGLQMLGQALGRGAPQTVVTDADWPLVFATRAYVPLAIRHLGAREDGADSQPSTDSPSILERFRATPEPQRAQLVEDEVRGLIARVLRLDRSRIDATQPLNMLGLDSMLSIEIKNRLDLTLHVTLSVVDLLQGLSLHDISRQALAQLAQQSQDDQPERRRAAAGEERQPGADAILPRPVDAGPLPLSFAQERLWFLDQLTPGRPTYNIAGVTRIHGPFDITRCAQSIDAVVARHEILRTVFPVPEQGPHQVIKDRLSIQPEVFDLRHLDDDQRSERLDLLLRQEARRPFDLAGGPLLRVAVFALAPEAHVVLFAMHHIISDGWSTMVFFREMTTYYNGLAAGRLDQLPPLPIQYADYALWQRGAPQQQLIEWHLRYWQEHLPAQPEVLELPADWPRPALPSGRAGRVKLQVAPAQTQALQELGRSEGATLFQVLLGGFAAMLLRVTDQRELIIGTPVMGRQQPELHGLIGCFLNILPICVRPDPRASFRALLQQVRTAALDAFAHQDVPFDRLVEALKIERSLSYPPLCQVVFSFESDPLRESVATGQRLSFEEIDLEVARFDLTLELTERAGRLEGWLDYNADLFTPATAARLSQYLTNLLEHIARAPDTPVGHLEVLGAAERALLLRDWADASQPYPDAASIQHLFEAQASRQPDAPALLWPGGTWSYAQLNQRANQIARLLRAVGVVREQPVGLMLDRGPDQIAATLGTLKAGACYVPLDPAYPAERLRVMLEEASVTLVLTGAAGAGLAWPSGVALLDLAQQDAQLARQPSADLELPAHPDQLAYVMFTSGSTGWPKGVAVTHRSVVRLVCNPNYLAISSADVFLQLAPTSFDAATLEIWGPLLNGASLALYPEALPALHQLGEALERWRVSTLWLTAGLFHQMVDHQIGGLRPVKQLLAGGDVLSASHVQRVLRELPGCQMINGYGPTENTTFTCCHRFDPLEPLVGRIPIGRPVSNTAVYVLNDQLLPAPVGVPGELYVGGAGLARGYIGRPDLTAERFIPNPFAAPADRSLRLYRTGDIVRWRPDGSLEFIRRNDQQVKVRGFRVELGEIEAALHQHPQVQRALVTFGVDDPHGAKQLAAYVVLRAGQELQSGALQQFLQARLPGYMVPARFVALERLPLTPNGKVDLRALPPPFLDQPQELVAPGPPQSETEQQIAAIWASVLGRERVGINDNFFEIGGDSIQIIQIVARARQQGLPITPQIFFQQQTVAEQVAAVASLRLQDVDVGEAEGAVPLTPIQHWFFEQGLARPAHYNQAVLLTLRQPLDPALLERALALVGQQHDTLRLRFAPTSDGWGQCYGPATASSIAVVDLRAGDPAQESARLAEMIAAQHGGFDLADGPLLKLAYLRRSQHDGVLLIGHHLIVDRVSWHILIEDLIGVYLQLAQGAAPQLPAKTSSFKQWSERLADYCQRPAVRDELRYWTGLPWAEAAPLPQDDHGGANREGGLAEVRLALDVETTRALLNDALASYHAHINELLLTALARALGRWTGSETVICDIESHGRAPLFDDIDLSRTLGWFTTISPVLLRLPGQAAPAEAIRAIKEQMRAVPQQGFNYSLLRYLHPDPAVRAALQALPQAQVSFNYLGQVDAALAGAGDDAQPVVLDTRTPLGPLRAAENPRRYLIEVLCQVSEGQFRCAWSYSAQVHRPETIAQVADSFMALLQELIAHSQTPDAGGFTPSDFPDADLSQDELDRLFEQLHL